MRVAPLRFRKHAQEVLDRFLALDLCWHEVFNVPRYARATILFQLDLDAGADPLQRLIEQFAPQAILRYREGMPRRRAIGVAHGLLHTEKLDRRKRHHDAPKPLLRAVKEEADLGLDIIRHPPLVRTDWHAPPLTGTLHPGTPLLDGRKWGPPVNAPEIPRFLPRLGRCCGARQEENEENHKYVSHSHLYASSALTGGGTASVNPGQFSLC